MSVDASLKVMSGATLPGKVFGVLFLSFTISAITLKPLSRKLSLVFQKLYGKIPAIDGAILERASTVIPI